MRKTFQFEAAHSLPNLPAAQKCYRLHGHSFKVDLEIAGECDKRLGCLMDYAEINRAFDPILEHHHMNEIESLYNPISDNRARCIKIELNPRLPLIGAIEVAKICNARCVYRDD